MENIMKPEPHKIVSVIRQTAAEFTIRVACDKDPGYGQFFQLSLPKIGVIPYKNTNYENSLISGPTHLISSIFHSSFSVIDPGLAGSWSLYAHITGFSIT